MTTECFLSCDWGTSQFRLRLVKGPNCEVIAELRSADGVGRLAEASRVNERPQVFRSKLAAHIAALARQRSDMPQEFPVVISGMASSTIGWAELPYAILPFALDGSAVIWKDLGRLEASQGSYPVILLSGIRGEWEIMRGEETEVLGLTRSSAARFLKDEALIVLPGTHSKHVHVKGGSIVDFATYMTGELFEVLSLHSVLKHSLSPPARAASEAVALVESARHAFEEGVEAARSAPLLEQLFHVRTRQVLHGHGPEDNRAFLSGLLIGAELAGLKARYAGSVPLVLCGGEFLAEPYEIAWQTIGAKDPLHVVPRAEAERLSLLGQAVVLNRILTSKS